ncbi:MAG TPA: energy transducer TonB [Blastocatellia bacterium]|nr:energy transducer TonB [Blastocatellia bacterium]
MTRRILLTGVMVLAALVADPSHKTAAGDARIDMAPSLRLFQSGSDDRNIEGLAVTQIQPSYPPLAEKYRIEGVVTVELKVSRSGKVEKAEFVRGHTIFRAVSLDAAKLWQFKVPGGDDLTGTIKFTFKLRDK